MRPCHQWDKPTHKQLISTQCGGCFERSVLWDHEEEEVSPTWRWGKMVRDDTQVGNWSWSTQLWPSLPSLSKGMGCGQFCTLCTYGNSARKLFVCKSKIKTMLLNRYRLAEKTWAWLLTDFIPSRNLQWLDTGLSVMADPMKFTAGGWCSPQV